LREILPISGEIDNSEIYTKEDTYPGQGGRGHAAEHEQIFDPIEDACALIREIMALMALHVGAFD
jgi:hypothetical protein